MKTIVGTWLVNGTVLAVVQMVEIKDGLSCLLIAITIAYTIWKWRRIAKRKAGEKPPDTSL